MFVTSTAQTRTPEKTVSGSADSLPGYGMSDECDEQWQVVRLGVTSGKNYPMIGEPHTFAVLEV